jgi:hypothetical protein
MMTASIAALATALADRYRIERELGGGARMAELVTEVTARLTSLKRPMASSGALADRPATERLRERNARPGARESHGAALAADSGADSAVDPRVNPDA